MGFRRLDTPFSPDERALVDEVNRAAFHLERCREATRLAQEHEAAAAAWVKLAKIKLEGWRAQEEAE